MKSLLRLILPLILVLIGSVFIHNGINSELVEGSERLQQLVDDGRNATGVLSGQYTKHTTQIEGQDIVTYGVSYTFKIDGKEYKGSAVINEKPVIPIVEVRYLPENPSINEINPKRKLGLDGKMSDTTLLFLGVSLVLIGIFFSWMQIKSIRK